MMKSFSCLRQMRLFIVLPALLLSMAGCVVTAHFDQYVYIQTTSLKVDARNIMELATEDYAIHQQDVKLVTSNMDKIYEYEKNRGHNDISIQLWDKMKDSTGHLYAGFMKRWKTEGKLRPVFIRESEREVGDAFEIIARLESKKIKPKNLK